MRLSKLQKYIIMKCYGRKDLTISKVGLYDYYKGKEEEKNKLNMQVGVQKSIENLVEKDFAVAFGRKTAKKMYVDKIKLTAKGKKLAKELINKRQRKLPIK